MLLSRASLDSTPANDSHTTSPSRQTSSVESHQTSQSDPKTWLDQLNQKPTATFDNNTIDDDAPFFQKESDSSNGKKPYAYLNHPHSAHLPTGQSSSGDDYRSVIDELTVELQKLKDELKKYKTKGPELLQKDKLFEIKYHGLPKRKRRELEFTLRDFTASVDDLADASSSQRKKSSRHTNRDHTYSGSGSLSKHASSSSGSHARPVDSAYASMSSGANSSGMSMSTERPPMSSRASKQKVQSYLRDIPEGLYPQHTVLTDRGRKKLVVRRLEQLFTGKIGGQPTRRAAEQRKAAEPAVAAAAPVDAPDAQLRPPNSAGPEPSREAKILPPELQSAYSQDRQSRSMGNCLVSNFNIDQTESGGNGNINGSGTDTLPTQSPPPHQRPTRLKDLDPDRVQVPSENLKYIHHLDLAPRERLTESNDKLNGTQSDADGWVYLNLLCNLAQLHIINVTPSFVRCAVTEISTKFQLSHDGRKIRWRGGSEGSRFSSDSSGDYDQKIPDRDDTDSGQHKRQETESSESFQYKPLFVHSNSSPNGQTAPDGTISSCGLIEDSNVHDSRSGQSGSGTYNRRKRLRDGAVTYYSGAPFCTDLSGNPCDASPATYMLSSGQDHQEPPAQFPRPPLERSESGSSLTNRPLSEMGRSYDSGLKIDMEGNDGIPDLLSDLDTGSSSNEIRLSWSSKHQCVEVHPLQPCGIGGVISDDRFMVIVTTKRPEDDAALEPTPTYRKKSEEATELIITRLASMSTSSPIPIGASQHRVPVEIEYVSGRIKRLAPLTLPPPVIFVPPSSSDSDDSDSENFGSE